MEMPETEPTATKRPVWNSGRTVGAKHALKPKQICEIRYHLNQRRRLRDRALFGLAIDSKLWGCDHVQRKMGDIISGGRIRTRAIFMQRKQVHPFSSNCSPTLVLACSLGSSGGAARSMTMSFLAGLTITGILAPASTPGS